MDYSPFDPDAIKDPYPFYAYLREHAPVYGVPGLGFSVVTRHSDVSEALRSPQRFSSDLSELFGELSPFQPEAPSIIFTDAPYHTRLRSLVSRAFTPRSVSGLEPRTVTIARDLLDAARGETKEIDVVEKLAVPLPAIVTADLLGVPGDMYLQFKDWVESTIRATTHSQLTDEDRAAIRADITEFRAYFSDMITRARAGDGRGLILDLVQAEDKDRQPLTDEEVLTMIVTFVLGGLETTTNLIGNAVLALLDHPAIADQLRADPDLTGKFVEEVLRHNAPNAAQFRRALEDTELGETKVAAGTSLLLNFAAANRDPEKFPDPDTFSMTRSTEGHLGFGWGIHVCIGMHLARQEGRVAINELLQRFANLQQVSGEVQWVDSMTTRGPTSLVITEA